MTRTTKTCTAIGRCSINTFHAFQNIPHYLMYYYAMC